MPHSSLLCLHIIFLHTFAWCFIALSHKSSHFSQTKSAGVGSTGSLNHPQSLSLHHDRNASGRNQVQWTGLWVTFGNPWALTSIAPNASLCGALCLGFFTSSKLWSTNDLCWLYSWSHLTLNYLKPLSVSLISWLSATFSPPHHTPHPPHLLPTSRCFLTTLKKEQP